jgi:hypothetical protein
LSRKHETSENPQIIHCPAGYNYGMSTTTKPKDILTEIKNYRNFLVQRSEEAHHGLLSTLGFDGHTEEEAEAIDKIIDELNTIILGK